MRFSLRSERQRSSKREPVYERERGPPEKRPAGPSNRLQVFQVHTNSESQTACPCTSHRACPTAAVPCPSRLRLRPPLHVAELLALV